MNMNKVDLEKLTDIDGFMAAALVDLETGMLMSGFGEGINLEVAGAGNTEVLKAKLKVAEALNLKQNVEDILITLDSQYHMIRPLLSNQKVFLYLVLNKDKSNLAMARHTLRSFEKELDFS